MREYPDLTPRGGRPPQSPPNPRRQGPAESDQPLWRRAVSPDAPHEPRSQRDPRSLWARRREGPPQIASYEAEDSQVYTLRNLIADEETQVSKRRAAPEAFPPTRQQRAQGATLLRLSGFALLGALLGGAPGVALGTLIALIALVKLTRFEQRTRVWRRKAKDAGAAPRLPARATSERLRLMTAFWQSASAVVIGAAALVLLLTALR